MGSAAVGVVPSPVDLSQDFHESHRGLSDTEIPIQAWGPLPESRPTVSIVLATLNERDGLPRVVKGVQSLNLPQIEVIIVDDGSSDGTREYLSLLQAEDPRFHPILRSIKRSLTPAQCEGWAAARGQYVVMMDADLQHPVEVLPKLVNCLQRGADLAVASRYALGGTAGVRPALRGVTSRGAEVLAKILLPAARRVRDPLSGFFAFRRDAYPKSFRVRRGYKLLLSLLATSHDRAVVEVPYAFAPRGSGSSKIFRGVGFVPIFLSELLTARRASSSGRSTPDEVVDYGTPSSVVPEDSF